MDRITGAALHNKRLQRKEKEKEREVDASHSTIILIVSLLHIPVEYVTCTHKRVHAHGLALYSVCVCVCMFLSLSLFVVRSSSSSPSPPRPSLLLSSPSYCVYQSLIHTLSAAHVKERQRANVPTRNTNTNHWLRANSSMCCSFVSSLTRSFVRLFVRSLQCVSAKTSIRISFPKCMFWMRPSRNIQWLRLKATGRILLLMLSTFFLLS